MKRWFVHIVVFVLACLSGFDLLAQQPGIVVELDTGLIAIGEQINLTMRIEAPREARVEWPEWKDTLVDKIEILEASNPDTLFKGEYKSITQNLILTGFDSGFFVVPPIVASIDQGTYQSRPFLINVITYEIDTIKGINDIKGIQKADFGWRDMVEMFWPIGVAMVGFAALGFLMVWLGRHRKKKKEIKPKPQIAPHVLAIRRLEELQKKQLWQQGQVKEYHASFSEIIREYIENQFGIQALEQTTDEIMQQLRVVDIQALLKEELQRHLMLSDLVKFAKHQPLPPENERILSFSFEFVERTIPKPEEKVEEELTESQGGES